MRKVITFGVFDYFHLGHLRLFQKCKGLGDHLTVAVQHEDFILKFKPQAKVLYSTEERVELVRSLRVVDEVVVYQSISPEFLSQIDFDVLAVGEDQTGERFQVSIKWCEQNGKEVIRMKRTPGICSSGIKNGL